MGVKIRVRCPCCGMIADKDRVEALEQVPVEVFEQTFGGRIPRALAEDYTKRRGTKGIITYTEVDSTMLEEVKAMWRKRLEVASEVLKE